MRIRVLGETHIADHEDRWSALKPKAAQVLALLIVAGTGGAPLINIIDHVWGTLPPTSAEQSVRNYINQIRTGLGESAHEDLTFRDPYYALTLPEHALDTNRFERLADQGSARLKAGDVVGAEQRLTSAIDLWRGEPFGQAGPMSVLEPFRKRLAERRALVFLDQTEIDNLLGKPSASISALEEILATEVLDERVALALMKAHYRSKHQRRALDVFQGIRRASQEVSLTLGDELVRAEQAVLNRDDVYFTSRLASPVRRLKRLPATISAAIAGLFVGRSAEMSQLLSLTNPIESVSPFVFVHGPSGIGKTRLLAETAAAAAPSVAILHGWCVEGPDPLGCIERLLEREIEPSVQPHTEFGLASKVERSSEVLASQVLETIESICAGEPCILVLDDLQWIDSASARVLPLVVDLAKGNVRILGSYRDDDEHSAGFGRLLQRRSQGNDVSFLAVGGISESDTVELLEGLAPMPVALRLRRFARDLTDLTGGNPFLLESLVRSFVAEVGEDRTLFQRWKPVHRISGGLRVASSCQLGLPA